MRIVHLTPLYFPSVGGYQIKIRELSERLAARGHDVWIITTMARTPEIFTRPRERTRAAQTGSPSPRSEIRSGVHIERLDLFSLPALAQYGFDALMKRWWTGGLWKNDAMRTAWLGPHMLGLRRTLARIAPEVLLAGPLPYATPYAGVAAARRLGIPCAVIPCLHPHQAWEFENRRHYALLTRADAVVPNTHYEAEWARSMGARMKQVCVLGDGVDAAALAAGDAQRFRKEHGIETDEIMVLFAGRKESNKGALCLLEAAQSVWQRNASVRFVFAGPAGDGWPRARAAFTGNNKILDVGPFDEAAKRDLFAAADLVALPSRAESLGIVFLEAWACSTPVIGCRTGAVCTVVEEGADGLLVPFGDVQELANAVCTLAGDPALRTRLGSAGKAKVEHRFNWDILAGRLEELYEQLIAERP